MSAKSELCKKADISLRISERISLINKDLAPLTHIRKLLNKPVIDHQLLESMDQEDAVKLAVKLVVQLNDVKVLLRDCRTVLEDIDTLPPLDPSPQIRSQISDLQFAPVRSGIDCEWSTKNFIQYFHGSTKSKILITVSHGGKVKAGSIPDRTVECCNGSVAGCKTSKQPVTTSGSVNTIEFGMALRENLGVLTGEKAHLVVNHLHRSKMDGNREINNAAQHDPDAEDAWEDYQEFISTARRAISETGGGVLFDVIGNTRKQVELGYLLFSNGLKKSDDQLDYSISSVKNLVEARGVKFSDVVRGDISLGTLIQTQGLDAVPSLGNPVPESGYGSGGYTVKQWGSKFGGDVDAIHLGLPSGVRKGYKESAPKIAKAIVQFMTVYG